MLAQKLFNYNSRLLVPCVSSMNILVRDVHHHMERDDFNLYVGIKRSNPQKANRNTHTNEKPWRRARGRKNIPIEMPDYRADKEHAFKSPADVRISLLRRGFNIGKDVGSRDWSEQQLTLHSFYGVLDGYIPPSEALPLTSMTSVSGLKEKGSEVKGRFMNRWHSYFNGTRKIKKKEGMKNFNKKDFAQEAERIYVEAYKALAERNKDRLLGLITEFAYEKMWPDVERGTLQWEHCGFKSPSKVLNVRCGDYPYKSGNDIAQIVVRMHSVQKYVLYDRFGRLLLGSSLEPKEVVEYVVFENHIAREGSVWRLNDKIYPQWAEKKDGVDRPTIRKAIDALQLPETTVPITQGWDGKIKRDEEKLNEERGEKRELKKAA